MAKEIYSSRIRPNLERIEWWLKNGATVQDICQNIGVSVSSFFKYLDKANKGDSRYLEFSETFVRARRPANEMVESALFKSACGYQWVEKITEKVFDASGNLVATKEKSRIVDVPPNPAAQQFWLANMMRGKWQFKPSVIEQEDSNTGVVLLPEIKDEQ